MSDQMTFEAWFARTSSAELQAGTSRSSSQDGQPTERSGPGAVRASRTRSLDGDGATTTPGTSGRCGGGSSPSARLQLCLANRLRERLDGFGSPLYALTWKSWDMPSGPQICALRGSALRTSDSGCSSGRFGWGTPRAHHGYGSPTRSGAARSRIEDQVQPTGWATPAARDWRDGRASEATMNRNSRPLNEQAVMLAGPPPTGSPAPTGKRGQLNPELPRWLQGYPPEWSDSMPHSDDWRAWQDLMAQASSEPAPPASEPSEATETP